MILTLLIDALSNLTSYFRDSKIKISKHNKDLNVGVSVKKSKVNYNKTDDDENWDVSVE